MTRRRVGIVAAAAAALAAVAAVIIGRTAPRAPSPDAPQIRLVVTVRCAETYRTFDVRVRDPQEKLPALNLTERWRRLSVVMGDFRRLTGCTVVDMAEDTSPRFGWPVVQSAATELEGRAPARGLSANVVCAVRGGPQYRRAHLPHVGELADVDALVKPLGCAEVTPDGRIVEDVAGDRVYVDEAFDCACGYGRQRVFFRPTNDGPGHWEWQSPRWLSVVELAREGDLWEPMGPLERRPCHENSTLQRFCEAEPGAR